MYTINDFQTITNSLLKPNIYGCPRSLVSPFSNPGLKHFPTKRYEEAYFRSIVELILKHLPSEKFKRNVVRGKLDLVVSMGGTAALFIGASLLSFVEILYYFGPRFLWDIWLKRRTSRNKPEVTNTNVLPLVN